MNAAHERDPFSRSFGGSNEQKPHSEYLDSAGGAAKEISPPIGELDSPSEPTMLFGVVRVPQRYVITRSSSNGSFMIELRGVSAARCQGSLRGLKCWTPNSRVFLSCRSSVCYVSTYEESRLESGKPRFRVEADPAISSSLSFVPTHTTIQLHRTRRHRPQYNHSSRLQHNKDPFHPH